MVTLFRAGKLPTVGELRNDNALWFDSLSTDWFAIDSTHVERSNSVFMCLDEEALMFWAERRLANLHEASMWTVEIPDEVVLYAYKYGYYDQATWGNYKGDTEAVHQNVSAYWISGVETSHWYKMWSQWVEGYETCSWEVKVAHEVASVAQWTYLGRAVREEEGFFTTYEWERHDYF